jgi:hypothetical protein
MSLGTPGSATYAVTLSGIEEMMTVLPDNVANQIAAQDVRNVVLTLYEELNGLSASMTSTGFTFSNPDNTSITVGGISSGSNLYALDLQDIFDLMFYPYVAPVLSISVSPPTLEYGSTQGVNVGWSVIIKKNDVISQSITSPFGTLYSTPIGIPNANTAYTGPTLLNQSVTPNTTTTFTFSLSDLNTSNGSGGPKTATANVTWSNRRYWGTFATFVALNSAQILALSNSELSTTRVQTRNGIDGGGDYLVFAWPTSFGNPTFVVNGLPNTAWSKVNNSFTFTNTYGYTASYDVWMSNTQQNSPITTFQIN